ncbi:MAG: hypothetical protein QM690_22325 [Sphingobium sp.]
MTRGMAIGGFDEPRRFRPASHFGTESLREAWLDTTGLPRQRASDHEPLTGRWLAATGKVPE